MNEYEKFMYKKEQDKIIGKLTRWLTIIVILALAFIFTSINGIFISPDVVKNVAGDYFSDGAPYPPVNNMIDHGNGWVVISANASNEKDGLEKLRKTYTKISKKVSTKKVDKIMIAVYEYSGIDWGLTNPYKTGNLLFTSNIWVKDIKSTDWENIGTYGEFKEKAGIQ